MMSEGLLRKIPLNLENKDNFDAEKVIIKLGQTAELLVVAPTVTNQYRIFDQTEPNQTIFGNYYAKYFLKTCQTIFHLFAKIFFNYLCQNIF